MRELLYRCKHSLFFARNGETGLESPCVRDFLVKLVLPLCFSALLSFSHVLVKETAGLLTVVSIVTGLMVATATMLFEIRRVAFKEDARLGIRDEYAINELFYISIWVVIVGLICALSLTLHDLSFPFPVQDFMKIGYSALIYFLLIHFYLVVIELAVRLHRAYARVASMEN